MTDKEYDRKVETIAFLNARKEEAIKAGDDKLVEALDYRILIEMMS